MTADDAQQGRTPVLSINDSLSDNKKDPPTECTKLWSSQTFKTLVFGQAISLMLCGTGVTSQSLEYYYKVSLPTTQSFLNYIFLSAVFLPWMYYQGRLWPTLKSRWKPYLLLSLIDVEGNFLTVKAYQNTTLTSVQVLDCFTIVTVLVLSYAVLKHRYSRLQYAFVSLCAVGMATIIVADSRHDSSSASNRLLGDVLAICGSILYGISNVAEEHVVKSGSSVEFLGMLGLGGAMISGIQMAVVERKALRSVRWSGGVVGLMLGYNVFLFLLYVMIPVLVRKSSATLVNLSFLTSDVYSVLFGIFLFHAHMSWLYVLGFVVIMIGLFGYTRAESQAETGATYTLLATDEERQSLTSHDEPETA